MSMPPAYLALQTGQPEKRDPQYGVLKPFPPAEVGVMLSNGFVVQQGPLRLVAWATPGHAPGSTSWSWRSCENGRCANIVYADSVTSVSAEGYRFSDHPAICPRVPIQPGADRQPRLRPVDHAAPRGQQSDRPARSQGAADRAQPMPRLCCAAAAPRSTSGWRRRSSHQLASDGPPARARRAKRSARWTMARMRATSRRSWSPTSPTKPGPTNGSSMPISSTSPPRRSCTCWRAGEPGGRRSRSSARPTGCG